MFSPANPEKRLLGLDSIRFLCALVVVHNHLGNPQFLFAFNPDSLPVQMINGIFGVLFNAPAAVIVFFVLSGFCIHYPYRNGIKPDPVAFLIQRYIRLGVPLLIAIPTARHLGVSLELFEASILWSLFAELAYYSLYPLLIILKRKMGWGALYAVASVGALGVVLTNYRAENYPAYGLILNSVLGLPCWLLGLRLADKHDNWMASGREPRVWRWRVYILMLSSCVLILRFHTPLKYPLTLNLFAIFAFFWLREELAYYATHRPWRWLEKLGRCSYSLYLFHLPSSAIVGLLFASQPPLALWLIRVVAAFIFSLIFYAFVEHPSHTLARYARLSLLNRIRTLLSKTVSKKETWT